MSSSRPQAVLRRVLAEPLAQFALIGLALFAFDRLTAEPVADPNRIVVDERVYAELAALHREAQGSLPDRATMERLVRQHVINETLLREARALRLDEGDQMMRERMIQRVRLMIYNGVALEPPPEAELRDWFERHRDDYVRPPRIGFDLLALDATEAEARALAGRLRAGDKIEETRRLARFRERPRPQVVKLLGAEFVEALEAGDDTGEDGTGEDGAWRALPSPRGWQVARHLGTEPGYVPEFDEVLSQVRGEWVRIETQRAAIAALDALRERYPVERAPLDPALLVEGDGGDGVAAGDPGAADDGPEARAAADNPEARAVADNPEARAVADNPEARAVADDGRAAR